MDELEKVKLRKDLLIQESAQLHDNIQRNLNEMHKLLGLAFPVLTGAFAFVIEGKLAQNLEVGLLYSLFSIVASLLIVSFNNIWMQLLTFTRYKYAEVLPRLYELSGRDGDNYGQYTVRDGLLRTMIGVVIVQAILLPTSLAAAYQVWTTYSKGLFAIPAYISILLVVATTIVSWVQAAQSVRTIETSRKRAGTPSSATG